jgi:uncharacterized protein YndB with AHSA1/START domain
MVSINNKENLTKITADPVKQEIIIEREFDASRELVFKAFTDPKLYVQWLGPHGLITKLESLSQEMEVHGGTFKRTKTATNMRFMA